MIKRIAKYKNYTDRARWYIVLIQFIMIAMLFLQNNGLDVLWWHYPVVIAVILLLLLVLGYLDKRLGIFEAEQEYISSNNPVVMDLKSKLDEILERVNNDPITKN